MFEAISARIRHHTLYSSLSCYHVNVCTDIVEDPMLFLHRVNIDRLWALWQTYGAGRDVDYDGPQSDTSRASAAMLDNILYIGNFLPSISVFQSWKYLTDFFGYQY